MFLDSVNQMKLRQPYCGEVVLGLRTRRLASWKTEALLHASAIADAIRQLVNLVRYLVWWLSQKSWRQLAECQKDQYEALHPEAKFICGPWHRLRRNDGRIVWEVHGDKEKLCTAVTLMCVETIAGVLSPDVCLHLRIYPYLTSHITPS